LTGKKILRKKEQNLKIAFPYIQFSLLGNPMSPIHVVREAGMAEVADLFPKPEKTFDSSIQFC